MDSFCAFGMVAAFGVGNSTQISTAVTSINEALIFLGLTPPPGQSDGGAFGRRSGGPGDFGGAKRLAP